MNLTYRSTERIQKRHRRGQSLPYVTSGHPPVCERIHSVQALSSTQ